MKKIQSITVIGRLYFSKKRGSTYYSAEILVNGEFVHRIDYRYGSGDQYVWDAFAWLAEGIIDNYEHGMAPWRWAEENKVKLYYTYTKVMRRQDL